MSNTHRRAGYASENRDARIVSVTIENGPGGVREHTGNPGPDHHIRLRSL